MPYCWLLEISTRLSICGASVSLDTRGEDDGFLCYNLGSMRWVATHTEECLCSELWTVGLIGSCCKASCSVLPRAAGSVSQKGLHSRSNESFYYLYIGSLLTVMKMWMNLQHLAANLVNQFTKSAPG